MGGRLLPLSARPSERLQCAPDHSDTDCRGEGVLPTLTTPSGWVVDCSPYLQDLPRGCSVHLTTATPTAGVRECSPLLQHLQDGWSIAPLICKTFREVAVCT